MKLSLVSDDGHLVHVAAAGRLTQNGVGPFHEPLMELLGQLAYTRHVFLDLSSADHLDSSGVGWLLTCHKRFREGGGTLTLRDPSPLVINVLRILKLETVLAIEPSIFAATGGGGAT